MAVWLEQAMLMLATSLFSIGSAVTVPLCTVEIKAIIFLGKDGRG